MTSNCDACGNGKNSSGWMEYHGIWGEERDILLRFIYQKGGKNLTSDDFKLCGECKDEYKKLLSQTLKDKIIAELAQKKSLDCQLFIEYGHGSHFEPNHWEEIRENLAKNIQRYRNEWQIKQMNYNRDGKEYFHPESGRQVSELTMLVHQSAPVEHTSNGFLIIKQPEMYLKEFFSPSIWTKIEKDLSQASTQPPKFPNKLVFGIIVGGFLLIGVIIVGSVYYKKRKIFV